MTTHEPPSDAERYRVLFERSPVGIGFAALDGTVNAANPALCALWGRPAEALIGIPWRELIHPDDRAVADADLEQLRATGADSIRAERRFLRPDGSTVWADSTGHAVRGPSGEVRYWQVVLVDITDRKRDEARFQQLLAAAPVAILGGDENWRVVLANGQAERLFGYRPGELVGEDVGKLFPEYFEAVRSGERSRFGTALTPGEVVAIELAARRRDGARFSAEMSLTTIATPDGWLALAGIRDATERERAAIVQSSSDAIVGKTLDGVITSWNPGAEQMYGYTAAEMVGRSMFELVPRDRTEELRGLLARLAEGERIAHLETKRLHKDGSVIDVSLSASPIRDAAGAIIGASAVARDTTEQKRISVELASSEARLRQSERLESLGRLAGGIAHDFNNLLGAILSYAGFVAEEVADNTAVLADVEQISAAGRRAARLTRQLLVFAKSAPAQPEILDLNAILVDIAEMLSRTIGEQIELTVRPAGGLPTIRADRGQVEQVLLNLAVNARDAMPDGGKLILETRESELDEQYCRLHPDANPGRYVELTVSDTGVGMSTEVAGRIFEPFFTTKPKGEGTGLGLATVYGILTDGGGSLSVYSEEGTGTTFRAYFPSVGVALRAPEPGRARPGRGSGETILVVEDDESVMKVTARILSRNGYRVLQATTGTAALELVAERELRLVLTDSVMPQMSGRELARQIGQLRPGLPVLFMSGYSEGVLQPDHLSPQSSTLIQKPFTEQALIERVQKLISVPGGPHPE